MKSKRFLLLAFILFLGCKAPKEPDFLLRASLFVNEDHIWSKAFEHFGELIEDRSNGRMKLEVYHSEQLAKEIESIRLIQANVIDMTLTGSLLSNWSDIATFCELPYLINSDEELKQLITGPVGKRIEQAMIDETQLRPLTYFLRGPRHLTSNKPIHTPEDLKGLIVRVPNVPSFVTAWAAMGAKPTPMAYSEIFTALQQGTIDAQENSFDMILNAGLQEVQKYVTLTEHVMSWSYPVIGEKQFQRLPADLQKLVLDAAIDMQVYEHDLFLKNEAKIKDVLRSNGMEIIEVDKSLFAAKCEKGIYESLTSEMKEVYREIKLSQKK
ncbi:tripartite ATP-independent transporter solute receptor, DctP family [Spirosomataceae bacterium TFI 002]|nr:tripartite ATP-independent transporter solute receptor, DctP family [Spirosomataceae bacterium TFI 002]